MGEFDMLQKGKKLWLDVSFIRYNAIGYND
jgi:hypothetical protein